MSSTHPLYTLLSSTPPEPTSSQEQSATAKRGGHHAGNGTFESRVLLGLDSSIAVIEAVGRSVEVASSRIDDLKDIEHKVEQIGHAVDGFCMSFLRTFLDGCLFTDIELQ
jgi:hypothetical protein